MADHDPGAPGSDPPIVDGRPLRIRRAARGILLTPDASVLLCRFEFGDATVWALPGGGVDPGESTLDALRRELHEELGMVEPTVGAHVWSRRHIIPFIDGQWDGQDDEFFVVETPAPFVPQPMLTWDQLRAERLHELRWWTVAELEAATIDGVRFAPRSLARLVRSLVDDGLPPDIVDTGI